MCQYYLFPLMALNFTYSFSKFSLAIDAIVLLASERGYWSLCVSNLFILISLFFVSFILVVFIFESLHNCYRILDKRQINHQPAKNLKNVQLPVSVMCSYGIWMWEEVGVSVVNPHRHGQDV